MQPGRPLRTTVVRALGEHATSWDATVDRMPLPSPFLRSWWVDATAANTASHLLFHDSDGSFAGGVALVADRRLGTPRVRLAGAGVLCPDHLDAVVRPGAESAVSTALVSWITSRRSLLLDLGGLVQGSLIERALGRSAAPIDVAPYAVVPPDGGEFLSTLSASTRRSARRSDRRLSEDGSQHRRVSAEHLDHALADFRALHEARPDRAPLLAQLPVLRRALAAGMAAGEARVDVLESGGRAQAVAIAFQVGGRLSLYQVARSLDRHDDGAGTVLLHRVIADAVRTGAREVDLLRGDEAYKSSLAQDRRTLGRVRLARGPQARAQLAALTSAGAVRRRLVRSA